MQLRDDGVGIDARPQAELRRAREAEEAREAAARRERERQAEEAAARARRKAEEDAQPQLSTSERLAKALCTGPYQSRNTAMK